MNCNYKYILGLSAGHMHIYIYIGVRVTFKLEESGEVDPKRETPLLVLPPNHIHNKWFGQFVGTKMFNFTFFKTLYFFEFII